MIVFVNRLHAGGRGATLVGALLSFRVVDNIEIYARGENLLDEDYEEVYGFKGQSRAGYLGFRVNWSL